MMMLLSDNEMSVKANTSKTRCTELVNLKICMDLET